MADGNVLPFLLVALVCAGMGLSFYVADRATPSSRALALAFGAIGVSLFLHALVPLHLQLPATFERGFALVDALGIVALLQWILHVRRTVPSATLETRSGDTLVRWGQAAGIAYGVAGTIAPEARRHQFLNALTQGVALDNPMFWLFAVPVLIAVLTGVSGLCLLLNRRPDIIEQRRVVAMLLAIPLFGASFALPEEMAVVSLLLGALVFLIGAVQYHVEQGRRGEFMAQFLSPQVAEMVRRQGLEGATAPARLEVSVVAVDLRGFTAVTAGSDSKAVLAVLRRYYAEVGRVAARFGGTVKDQAGDGVLILVGAPVPDPQHRRHALDMARALRETGARLSMEWRAQGMALGVGVGVASGLVTAGLIGEGARREYTAVGTPVNLAARLCAQAADGEVLLAPESAGFRPKGLRLEPLSAPLTLKGLPEPVTPLRLL